MRAVVDPEPPVPWGQRGSVPAIWAAARRHTAARRGPDSSSAPRASPAALICCSGPWSDRARHPQGGCGAGGPPTSAQTSSGCEHNSRGRGFEKQGDAARPSRGTSKAPSRARGSPAAPVFDRRGPGPGWPGGWSGGKRKGKRQQWGEGRHGAGIQPPGSTSRVSHELPRSLFVLALADCISSAAHCPSLPHFPASPGRRLGPFPKCLVRRFTCPQPAIATAGSFVFLLFPCGFGGLSPGKATEVLSTCHPLHHHPGIPACSWGPATPAEPLCRHQSCESPSLFIPVLPKGPGKGLESPEKFPL